MGWLRDWKRRRILGRHRIDDALWRRAKKHLPFLAGLSAGEERRLCEFAVVFLAEKQLTPVHGLGLSEGDRGRIARPGHARPQALVEGVAREDAPAAPAAQPAHQLHPRGRRATAAVGIIGSLQ